MTPAELITAAQTLLADGSAWCKGANARKANGLPCSPRSPEAVQWDLTGAILKSYEGETNYTSLHEVYSTIRSRIPADYKSRDIEAYNDFTDWDGAYLILTGSEPAPDGVYWDNDATWDNGVLWQQNPGISWDENTPWNNNILWSTN